MRRTIHYPALYRSAWGSQLASARSVIVMGLTLALAGATAACSDNDSPTAPGTPGNGPVTGSYAMKTVRGFAVPHTFTDAVGKKLTVDGGKLTLGPSNSYELNYKGRLNSLEFDLTDEGTVSIAGSTATFTPDDGDPAYTGTIKGKTISVASFKIAGAKFDVSFTGN